MLLEKTSQTQYGGVLVWGGLFWFWVFWKVKPIEFADELGVGDYFKKQKKGLVSFFCLSKWWRVGLPTEIRKLVREDRIRISALGHFILRC